MVHKQGPGFVYTRNRWVTGSGAPGSWSRTRPDPENQPYPPSPTHPPYCLKMREISGAVGWTVHLWWFFCNQTFSKYFLWQSSERVLLYAHTNNSYPPPSQFCACVAHPTGLLTTMLNIEKKQTKIHRKYKCHKFNNFGEQSLEVYMDFREWICYVCSE